MHRLAWLFLLVLLTLGCAGTARAQRIDLPDPWPDPQSVTGVRAEDVVFPSSSPFTPDEMGKPGTPRTNGIAQLFLPPDAGPDHKVPAVIMLHGAAGLVRERALYGPQLASRGVAVLVINTFGARTNLATGFMERLIYITESMMLADAYAGLHYLASRGDIDPARVVLTGFSYGGMSTIYAMYTQVADKLAPDGLRFAGHVAFYGPCIARFENHQTTGAPLLMLNGADDELLRPARCAQILDDVRSGGSTATLITYQGAVHQWDGGMSRRLIGSNLAPCDFTVERDDTIRDRNTWLPMKGPFLRRMILAMCVKFKQYPIGRDDAVRAKSNHDFGAFLMRVFNAGQSSQANGGGARPG